jgi:hypothetical protein
MSAQKRTLWLAGWSAGMLHGRIMSAGTYSNQMGHS